MKQYLISLILFSPVFFAHAQDADSLLNQIDTGKSKTPVEATFKSTRIILSQSVETKKKHDLDFIITHRFGDIGGQFGGSRTLYGLDVASDLFIGFDYGITDRLTIGIGRSRENQLYDGFLKYRLLQQQKGEVPVSVTLFAQRGWITRRPVNGDEFPQYRNRFSDVYQVIIARKFSDILSLEFLPTYMNRSRVTEAEDRNDLFTVGIAGRLKMTKRLSLIADYQIVNGLGRPSTVGGTRFYNPLGVGLEIETGGHVFSLNFMNAGNILENNFLVNTDKSWLKGGVRFGFTISRNFTLFRSRNADNRTTIK
ncbi:MAG: hypothetical protein INR69_03230 [Mucilaginibacter polytrichastri]|nr:hypothetical protein [Mucilaginibacter polytrichastri]